jgi:hypothetical protein
VSNGHSTDSPSSVAVVKNNESPVTAGKKEQVQKERFSNEIDEQSAAALIQSLKSAPLAPPPAPPTALPPKPLAPPPAPFKRENSSDNSKPSPVSQDKKKIETNKDDDSSSGASDSEKEEAQKKSEAPKKQPPPVLAPPVPAAVSNPAFNPSVTAKQEENLYVESTNPIHSSKTQSNDEEGDETSRNSVGSPVGRRSRGGRGNARHKPPPPPNGTTNGNSSASTAETKKDKELTTEDDNTVSNPITASLVIDSKKNSEEGSAEDYPITRNDDIGSFENSPKPTGAVRRRSANMKRVASSRAHLARTSITSESLALSPAPEPDSNNSEPAIKEITSGNSGREEPIQQPKKEVETAGNASRENSLKVKTTSVDSADSSFQSFSDLRSSSSSPKSSLKKPGSEKERDLSRNSLRVSFKEDLTSVVSNTDEDDLPQTKKMVSLELEEVKLSSRQPTVDPQTGKEKKRGCADSCILQ